MSGTGKAPANNPDRTLGTLGDPTRPARPGPRVPYLTWQLGKGGGTKAKFSHKRGWKIQSEDAGKPDRSHMTSSPVSSTYSTHTTQTGAHTRAHGERERGGEGGGGDGKYITDKQRGGGTWIQSAFAGKK